MKKSKMLSQKQPVKSKKVEQAASMFSRLTEEQKIAIIKLCRSLLEQKK